MRFQGAADRKILAQRGAQNTLRSSTARRPSFRLSLAKRSSNQRSRQVEFHLKTGFPAKGISYRENSAYSEKILDARRRCSGWRAIRAPEGRMFLVKIRCLPGNYCKRGIGIQEPAPISRAQVRGCAL